MVLVLGQEPSYSWWTNSILWEWWNDLLALGYCLFSGVLLFPLGFTSSCSAGMLREPAARCCTSDARSSVRGSHDFSMYVPVLM